MLRGLLSVILRKIIANDWIWASFDCTINRISEYAVIQRNEVLKNRVGSLVSKHGVLDGPFSGMRYLNKAHGSYLLPKILGTYESEIHSVVQEIIHNPPQVVIDIGCAEGYYAVGFAIKCKKTQVLAFDTAKEARKLTSELALVNTVSDLVEIESEFCVEKVLPTILGKTCFILCDIDGAENVIFQPENAGFLKDCQILVETHDGYIEGVTQRLLNIFHNTHNARVIDSNCDYKNKSLNYTTSAFCETNRVLRGRFFEEGRPFPQKWVYFTPR